MRLRRPYNPMSYHNGSVWPHDTAIAVAGLANHGFVQEAQQIALRLLDASEYFGGRLPELSRLRWQLVGVPALGNLR